jgi:enamine deaminase RidA (YjgF/YER057c/UK114 family)
MNRFHNPATMPPPASRYRQVAEVPGSSKLVLLSGQVGMRPDGSVPADFDGQAEQAYANVIAGLTAVGMDASDLVRINSFVTSADHVGKMRAIREKYLGAHECASTLVVVAALASPQWLVEIEAIAAKG